MMRNSKRIPDLTTTRRDTTVDCVVINTSSSETNVLRGPPTRRVPSDRLNQRHTYRRLCEPK